jgi:hypothetical protein
LYLAWSKYGRQSWRSLVAPALRLAQDGFPVNTELAAEIQREQPRLARSAASAALFTPKGKPLRAGDKLVQKDLARTLRLLAQSGALTFYEGAVADLIVKEMQRGHGLIDGKDLAAYRAVERVPLRGRYRDLDVRVVPPPSSGGITMLEALALLEYYDLKSTGPRSTYRVHLTVEALARAFADRNTYLGDPDFVRMPLRGLLAQPYIAGVQATISMVKATPLGGVRPGDPWRYDNTGISVKVGPEGYDSLRVAPSRVMREGNHTTHFSIVDAEGNIACMTTTLNSNFGSGVLVEGGGFLLNDEMDDFDAKPGACESIWAGGRRRQCDRARQAHAVVDGADARVPQWQAVARARLARRTAHPVSGARCPARCARSRHEPRGRGGEPAIPPPMAARGHSAGDGGLHRRGARRAAAHGARAARAFGVGQRASHRDRTRWHAQGRQRSAHARCRQSATEAEVLRHRFGSRATSPGSGSVSLFVAALANNRSHSSSSRALVCSGFSVCRSSRARALRRAASCRNSETRNVPAPCACAVARISRSEVTIVRDAGSACWRIRSWIQASALSRAKMTCKPCSDSRPVRPVSVTGRGSRVASKTTMPVVPSAGMRIATSARNSRRARSRSRRSSAPSCGCANITL